MHIRARICIKGKRAKQWPVAPAQSRLAPSCYGETLGVYRRSAAPYSSLPSRESSWDTGCGDLPTCSPNRVRRVSQPRLTELGEGLDADQRLKSIGTRDLSSRRPVSSHGGRFIMTLFRRSRLLGDKADALRRGFTAACREEIRVPTHVRSARTLHSRFSAPLLRNLRRMVTHPRRRSRRVRRPGP